MGKNKNKCKYKYKNLSVDKIRGALNGIMREPITKHNREPKITHYEWEEDGKQYSSWKIDTGEMILSCGDGGMDLFQKAVRDRINQFNITP